MAKLQLTVDARSPDRRTERVEMLAEILPVGPDRTSRGRRSATVTSGGSTEIEDLAPGAWQVQLTAPSGRRVVKDVTLQEGGAATVSFVSSEVQPTERQGAADRSSQPVTAKLMTTLSPNARTFRAQGRQPSVPQARLVDLNEHIRIDPFPRWTAVSNLLKQRRIMRGRTAMMGPSDQSGGWPVQIDERILGHAARAVVVASCGGVNLLQSIPSPWDGGTGDDRHLTVTLRAARGGPECEVSVADPGIAGVISYLGAGWLHDGARLVKESPSIDLVNMVREKIRYPFRACAAAYVLVGATDLSHHARWHSWLDNLAHLFGNIPDGLIILARFRLLKGDRENAARCVRDALARGLPHYAIGIAWLRELIAMMPSDRDIQAYVPIVNEVAAHVDVSKPFTCLRW